MILSCDPADLSRAHGASPRRAVTVGYFDGIHVGHQKLLGDLKAWAVESGSEPAVVTFRRHPQEVLTGSGPLRILSLEHRLLFLARAGIAATLVLDFDRAISLWSAEEFVRKAIVDGLGGQRLLIGFDSAFGHKRQGDFEYLSRRAASLGIEVRQSSAECIGGERISSTLVRQAVVAGDLRRLERILGRRFSLLGRVIEGDGRGRRIGFPTANLDVMGSALPPRGVYFAEASLVGRSLEDGMQPRADGEQAQTLGAVVNIGNRPTFKDSSASTDTVEAHLIDWSGDLYGQLVEVCFLSRHRDEMKFPSADALVAQIRADIGAFRGFVTR